MQSAFHPHAEGKDRNRPDKSFFCWSHTNMDGLQGAVLAQLNVYNAIHHSDKFRLLIGCHKQLHAHKQESMHMQTCAHTLILSLSSARKWCILTLEPQIIHLPTLEISRLRFKSSLCPLIKSQKSPWFYSWNLWPLYTAAQTKNRDSGPYGKPQLPSA